MRRPKVSPFLFALMLGASCLTSISQAQEKGAESAGANSALPAPIASAQATPETGERYGWVVPHNGVRLDARDVIANASLPLPSQGEAFYLFTTSALKRDQIAKLSLDGMRYLGLVGQNTYAMLAEADFEASRVRASLSAMPNTLGTALYQKRDRVAIGLLDAFDRAMTAELSEDAAQLNAELEYPLALILWSHVTLAEAQTLLEPEALSRLQLPSDAQGELGLENRPWISQEASTYGELLRLAGSPLVASIHPRYPFVAHNRESRALSNADTIIAAPLNLTGAGVVVGHWDGGRVYDSHPDFGGRVNNIEGGSVSSHATHTAGTILGSGAGDSRARGYAPGATMIAYNFNGDPLGERRAAKHQYRHEVDNHSWGTNSSNFGIYDSTANEMDVDARDVFLLAVKSAGNDGQLSQVIVNNYGFDSIGTDSSIKNGLCIGATQDGGDLTSFSGRGPVNDGRIKPDLSANGDELRSTYPNNGYASESGTSMSAPSVTGMITLLSELYKREYNKRLEPDVTRALMLQTVNDWFHPGPDYRHGWGNADIAAAADLLLADVASNGKRLVRANLRDGEMVEYKIQVGAGDPELKATINWLDAWSLTNSQKQLNHDLDMTLIDPMGTTHYPWTLDPANPFDDAVRTQLNTRDNIEQVLVDNPAAGEWTLRVTGRSISDPDLPVQGCVIASSHNLDRAIIRVLASTGANGLAIPDGNTQGLMIPFDVATSGIIHDLHLSLEINHVARGELRVELKHPDGRTVTLEGEDTSTRDDLYAVFPDTRSYDDDIQSWYSSPANGTYELRVIDTSAGGTGRVMFAELELDLAGVPGGVQLPNDNPTAIAGGNQAVRPGVLVELDGSQSSDPNGDTLTYSWVQTSGTSVVLSGGNGQRALFTAPQLANAETLSFELSVSDGKGGSDTDSVDVLIDPNLAPPNMPPVISVSAPSVAAIGQDVVMDASATTDPEGDPLSFQWVQTAGVSVALTAPGGVTTHFTAPDVTSVTSVTFRLTVNDNKGAASVRTVVVVIDPDAELPGTSTDPLDPINSGGGGGGGCVIGGDEHRNALWLALLSLMLLLAWAGKPQRR